MSATRFVQRPAAPAAAPSRDPLLGKSIGQCYLQRKLGEGGMATVYLARHVSLGRFVAVKVMTRGLPRDFRARERFMKEAQAAARLDHPNIVAVHDGGKEEGIDYLVMQYVEGESLGARLRRGERLTLAETLRIARGALAGLAHAHANGIIHRDVKPDNILLGRDGSVKLADFGLARLLEADCNLSLTGSNIIGTPHYMSPEQALTGKVDCRTDLYSVGATLFHMLTGVPPFVAPSSVGVLQKVVQEPLRPPRAVRSGVPAAFSEYVCLLMRKEPAKRIATASEALALLDRLVAAERRRPRRSRRVLRAAAVLVVSAVVVLLAAGTPLGTLARKALPGAEASARPGGGSQAPAAPLTRAEEKALRARLADLKRAARSGEPLRLLAFVDDTSRISVRRTFRGGGSVPQRREALFRRFLDEVQGLDPRAASVEARDALDGARAAVVAYPLPGEGGQRRLSWVERDGVWLLVPPGRQPSHGG